MENTEIEKHFSKEDLEFTGSDSYKHLDGELTPYELSVINVEISINKMINEHYTKFPEKIDRIRIEPTKEAFNGDSKKMYVILQVLAPY
jgi:hypothetical protein